MAERRTLDSWAAHLNIDGEELTIDQAMLLHLGHQNVRLGLMLAALQDMQARLTRLELFVQMSVPGYDDHVRAMLKRQLTEAAS